MPGLCEYSDVFGAPGEGAHKYRVGGLAAVDLIATGGLAFLLARFALRRNDALVFVLVFLILLVAGILVHEAFCVNTRLNATIFERPWPKPTPAPKKAGSR
jgi:hypothetical protein